MSQYYLPLLEDWLKCNIPQIILTDMEHRYYFRAQSMTHIKIGGLNFWKVDRVRGIQTRISFTSNPSWKISSSHSLNNCKKSFPFSPSLLHHACIKRCHESGSLTLSVYSSKRIYTLPHFPPKYIRKWKQAKVLKVLCCKKYSSIITHQIEKDAERKADKFLTSWTSFLFSNCNFILGIKNAPIEMIDWINTDITDDETELKKEVKHFQHEICVTAL